MVLIGPVYNLSSEGKTLPLYKYNSTLDSQIKGSSRNTIVNQNVSLKKKEQLFTVPI